jgi:hypothetical protein
VPLKFTLAYASNRAENRERWLLRPDSAQSESSSVALAVVRRVMPMSDKIRINGLFLRTIIGINHDEREHKQDVLINLSLSVDTRPAARTDQIEDAVNYRTITKNVIDLVENSRFF